MNVLVAYNVTSRFHENENVIYQYYDDEDTQIKNY